MRRALLLYNPHSGCGNFPVAEVESILHSGGYEVVCEVLDISCNQLMKHVELDVVIIAGGDGSVNHVVNSLKQASMSTTLAVIPTGTANDFARALGMSLSPLVAARQIVEGQELCVDCGRVNGLYFVNIFSFGLFTTTSQHTPHRLKRALGRFAYILTGIKELWRIHNIELQITTDAESFHVNALTVLILNGCTAGGFSLVRDGLISDGYLDCIILENRTFVASFFIALRYVMGFSPKSIKLFKARRIEITSQGNEPTDVDGQRGVDFPLFIESLHQDLRVITPNIDIPCHDKR